MTLPYQHFDAAVDCNFGDDQCLSAEQYCESANNPATILVDARMSIGIQLA